MRKVLPSHLSAWVFLVGAILPGARVDAQGSWNFNDLSGVQGNVTVRGTGRNFAGFAWEGQNTEHVFFIGSDGHVHELYHDSAWHHDDLTVASGDPGKPAGHLAAYVSEKTGTEHVFYVGNDFPPHIHELYYESGKWHAHDLNIAVPDAGLPDAGSASLTGFVFQKENTEHLFYAGLGSMHELYYDGAWHHSDLSKVTGAGPDVVAPGDIAAFVTDYDNTEHVVFFWHGGSGEPSIGEFWWNGSWHLNRPISKNSSGGAPVPAGGTLAGYVWKSRQSAHVIYIDAGNAHVQELYGTQAGNWAGSDLSNAVGNTKAFLPGQNGRPGAVSGLTGFGFDSDGTEHVVYVGLSATVNVDLWELYGDGSTWRSGGKTQYGMPLSMTEQFGMPNFTGVSPSTRLVGFSQERNKTEHIFFLSNTGHLCEIYHTP